MLTKQLQGLGFTEKEAKVYIGLLELGEATALELSQKTGLNRATIYVTLAGLEKRKLVGQIENHKKTLFSIEHPLQILDLLEKEKNNVEIKIHLAKSLMPELEMLEKVTGEKAKVKFYEGKEGIAMLQKDILRSRPKETLEIFNLNIILKNFPVAKDDHRQVFRKRKMPGRVIVMYDPKIKIPFLPPLPGKEMRYLPLNKYPFNSEIVLYNDKAILMSLQGKLMGVLIQNKAIVGGLSYLFELAWQGSEKYLQIKKGA